MSVSRRKKILIGVAIVLVGAAVVGANFYFKKKDGIVVTRAERAGFCAW